ncbi:MAG TPA: hypothetical protein V6D00_03990 [Pantanalinema sp.]
MRFKPFHALLPLLALSLAGCFGPSPSPGMIAAPGPYDMGMSIAAPDMASGPSLYDAYHQVQRYVSLHYGEARMVKSWADQVGSSGRIAKDGTWYFTYAVSYKVAPAASASPEVVPADQSSASYAAQGVEVPSRFETQYLTLALTGTNQLLAPETLKATAIETFDFGRALSLSKVLDICAQNGLNMGPFGVKVALRAGDDGGAVYEIDNTLSFQSPQGSPQPVYRGKMPYPSPTSAPYPYDQPYYGGGYAQSRLGTFVVDAYTGELLARP